MAKKPTGTTTPIFEPENFYEVTVSRVVPKVAGVTFRPGQSYAVKGRVAELLGDAVATSAPASTEPGV